MKKHYPREYMAALISSVLDSSTKVAEYIAECRDMGIRLLPPDVNESGADFTVSGENLRFGLVGIKGIGWGAIRAMVAEREQNGPFQSFEDFCRRMTDKEMNRRAIENLIRAGAFDSLGYKRRVLLQAAELILDAVNRESRDNIAGQMDLFGGDETFAEPKSITMPDLEEYSPQEKMQMEKEVTGLYLSGHPMDEYRDSLRRLGVSSVGAILGDFESSDGPRRFSDGQTVSIAGVVSSVRTRPTKNKSLMSYVVLEDDSGAMELIVFQKVLDSDGKYLKENAVLLVRGRISARDDKEPQLMAEALLPLEQAIADRARADEEAREKTLFVKLPSREDKAMRKLELLLTMFPGKEPLVIWCEAERKKIGARCRIHPALLRELCEMLGEGNVVVK